MTWRERVYGKKDQETEEKDEDARSFKSLKDENDIDSLTGQWKFSRTC